MKVGELEFMIVRQPQCGHLARHENGTVSPVIRFDMEDLTTGRIAYEHNDQLSSNASVAAIDRFSVVACLLLHGKRSEPHTVHVAIAARNNQPPYLTNHRVLRVNIGMKQYFFRASFFPRCLECQRALVMRKGSSVCLSVCQTC